nr:MAG TPA: hypothetical protein [Bacteriophage sp.]
MRRFENWLTFRLTDVLRIDKEIQKELFEMFLNCSQFRYWGRGSTRNTPRAATEPLK